MGFTIFTIGRRAVTFHWVNNNRHRYSQPKCPPQVDTVNIHRIGKLLYNCYCNYHYNNYTWYQFYIHLHISQLINTHMDIITRKEAKGQELSYYFTGHPCKHGHVSKRLTSSGVCYTCSLLFKRTPKSKQSYKQYRASYRDVVNERTLRYYHTKLSDKIKQLRQTNPTEGYKNQREWERRNPGKKQAISAKRRAVKLKATPMWFVFEKEQIDELYIASQQLTVSTGVLYTVDHIVPLQGELACGLHCLSNLRVLIGQENFSKGYKLIDYL